MRIGKVLKQAYADGNIEKIKEILDKRRHINWGFVKIACNNGQLNIIKYLLEKEEKKNRIIDFKIRNKMLILACRNGFCNIVIYLLDYCEKHCCNINIPFVKMLCIVIQRKYIDNDIVKSILEHCTRYKYILNIHSNNEHVFHIACKNKQINVIKYLIEYCENYDRRIDISIDNYKSLFYCIECGFNDIIKYLMDYLLKYKINIDIKYCTRTIFKNVFYKLEVDTMKDIIKYCEMMNNKIKLCVVDSGQTHNIDMMKYMFYLYKHNYNLDTIETIAIKNMILTKNISSVKNYIFNNTSRIGCDALYYSIDMYTINYIIHLTV